MDMAIEHVELTALAEALEGLEGYFSGRDANLDNLKKRRPLGGDHRVDRHRCGSGRREWRLMARSRRPLLRRNPPSP
jgi:hypothetical protein